jgi:hypothetical protein
VNVWAIQALLMEKVVLAAGRPFFFIALMEFFRKDLKTEVEIRLIHLEVKTSLLKIKLPPLFSFLLGLMQHILFVKSVVFVGLFQGKQKSGIVQYHTR